MWHHPERHGLLSQKAMDRFFGRHLHNSLPQFCSCGLCACEQNQVLKDPFITKECTVSLYSCASTHNWSHSWELLVPFPWFLPIILLFTPRPDPTLPGLMLDILRECEASARTGEWDTSSLSTSHSGFSHRMETSPQSLPEPLIETDFSLCD